MAEDTKISEQEEFEFRRRAETEKRAFVEKLTAPQPSLGRKVGELFTDLASPHLPAPAAAAIGTLGHLGAETIPGMLMGGGVGGATGRVLESGTQGLARRLMQSAIKPASGDLIRGKVEPAITTMLEQGYSPTNAGVTAMRQKAGGYMDEVANILGPSDKVVNTSKADQYLQALAERLRPGTKGPLKIEDVNAASAELRAHPAVDEAGLMSVQNAQKMKQANYRDIGDNAYGLNIKEQTARDALKAQTAALAKVLEEAHPEVAGLNAKAGELINAAKVAQRRALIEGNKDILPLGAGVGSALHNPAVALGMYANSSAYIKALLARALYSGGKGLPATGAMAGGALGAGLQENQ